MKKVSNICCKHYTPWGLCSNPKIPAEKTLLNLFVKNKIRECIETDGTKRTCDLIEKYPRPKAPPAPPPPPNYN